MPAPLPFSLPPELRAAAPAEKRGLRRDQVRLLVIDRATGRIEHSRFERLGEFLRPGDLLVLNASRTLPASLEGCAAPEGPRLEVRLAQHLSDGSWLALLLCREGDPFACGVRKGLRIDLGQSLTATIEDRDELIPRLWKLRLSKSGPELLELLYRLGRPIRYDYLAAPWGLDDFQTVYAREPGSAEMASAGRAFTWKLLFELRRRGVGLTFVLLHAGLSSYMDDELDSRHPVSAEEYEIGELAAEEIAEAHRRGGRVIAVGTTVVRALESRSDGKGGARPGRGYTHLRVTGDHRLAVVDGLLTGLHEPEASHLELLTAFLPPAMIRTAYADAVERGYLWHEFGDLNLIL